MLVSFISTYDGLRYVRTNLCDVKSGAYPWDDVVIRPAKEATPWCFRWPFSLFYSKTASQ